jgi:DNA repair and recombination protein RAD54B
MYRRQFVSPLLKRPYIGEGQDDDVSLEKKARLMAAQPQLILTTNDPPRTPLLNLRVPNYSPLERIPQRDAYFNVLWRNQTTRKNKTWDGDGVLVLEEGFLTLKDSDGRKCVYRQSITDE